MVAVLHEIDWSPPTLPHVPDAIWEAEVKRERGASSDIFGRVSPSPWLRRAALRLEGYKVARMPAHLMDYGSLVIAQENSCRYCYGATRAYMRILGYGERRISRIEREAQLAELDPKEGAYLEFCRKLARSNPRPSRADLERLIALGFDPLAVTEMAFFIAANCFINRLTTLLACPPEAGFEKFSQGFGGRMMALGGPLMRRISYRKRTAVFNPGQQGAVTGGGAFAGLVQRLSGLPAAEVLRDTVDAALDSPVLPRRTKLLMIAVASRALECPFCLAGAREELIAADLSAEEVDGIVGSLASPALDPFEARILPWVRETVHIQTPPIIQDQTRRLGEEFGQDKMLEAVGVAALANATVRLAMLLE